MVIIHHNDWDGAAAAWAVQVALRCGRIPGFRVAHLDWWRTGYDQAPPLELCRNRPVLLVDFCYPDQDLARLLVCAARVGIIDHHPTAKQRVDALGIQDQLDPWVFDSGEAACLLTWRHFHPDQTAPKALLYAADHDMYRFDRHESQAVRAYLHSLEATRANFELFSNLFEADPAHVFAAGREILRSRQAQVAGLASRMRLVRFDGQVVPAVNAGLLTSDVGHALLEAHPSAPFVLVYSEGPTTLVVSLYARPGETDVSQIAEKHGGGGHQPAAGFHMPLGTRIFLETTSAA